VRRVAESEGVALNQLVKVAVAGKLLALRTEDYFRERVARASHKPRSCLAANRHSRGPTPMMGHRLRAGMRRLGRQDVPAFWTWRWPAV